MATHSVIGSSGWLNVAALKRLAFFSLLYVIAVKLALVYDYAPQSVATLWPASGVFLAALLLAPRRQWPFYVVTLGGIQFLAEFSYDGPTGEDDDITGD